MNRLYLASSDIGLPPYECREVATRFDDVMALAHNAFMEIDSARMMPQNTGVNVLLEIALRDCLKNLDRLGYEIEKVT